MPLSPLHIRADRFHDRLGRQILLRGVNLGGDSKVPFQRGGTQFPSDFADHRTVSFVGRPFKLSEADVHLSRLRHWGFNCLRLLTTWEAVEHAGPREYDEVYLDFLAQVIDRAGRHGLYVFIDFHQDVWSRMSGGDGAPGWAFESVGLDFSKFNAAGAAHVMQQQFDYANPSGRQSSYPQMSWAQNYRMPANAIMWTLFWAGLTVTPDFEVGDVNIQEFLQSHLLGAMNEVAKRVHHMPHVLGFDTMNEPSLGWLGQALSPAAQVEGMAPAKLALPGPIWSPLQALGVARGLSIALPLLHRESTAGATTTEQRVMVNAAAESIWLGGRPCPFEQAGIYAIDGGQPVALREDAFIRHADGRPIDLVHDTYAPFFEKVANTVREHRADWLLFAEVNPLDALTGGGFPATMPAGSVHAGHWYDLALLVTKTFDPNCSPDLLTGELAQSAAEVRRRYARQLGRLKQMASRFTASGAPTLVGEFGIPFDLDEGQAYRAWAAGERSASIWATHDMALSLAYDALDELLLSSTQWNYTAGNRNDLRVGDQWNQEDLSIFSHDQQESLTDTDPDSGGRAVHGFCRPYVKATQGLLEMVRWSRDTGTFSARWQADPTVLAPTHVYMPRLQFPNGFDVEVDGSATQCEVDPLNQCIWFSTKLAGRVEVHMHRR